jgi:hypothetical protein
VRELLLGGDDCRRRCLPSPRKLLRSLSNLLFDSDGDGPAGVVAAPALLLLPVICSARHWEWWAAAAASSRSCSGDDPITRPAAEEDTGPLQLRSSAATALSVVAMRE